MAAPWNYRENSRDFEDILTFFEIIFIKIIIGLRELFFVFGICVKWRGVGEMKWVKASLG